MTSNETEAAYLERYNIHHYDLPLITVDMAIFTVKDEQLQVLLVQRAQHPAKGQWALPGGFIDLQKDQSLEDAAYRKLKEKTGVDTPYLEQVATVGNRRRDPRGWSVTVAYFALISSDDIRLDADSRSENIAWIPVTKLNHPADPADHLKNTEKLTLAFDHANILQTCVERLRAKGQYTSLAVNLLPEAFTLSELQKTFEIILGTSVEKKSFRRRILEADILVDTGEMKSGVSRPAKLYKVKSRGENHFFARNMEGGK